MNSRIETTELYQLNDTTKGITRIRPEAERDKKDQGCTWASLSNYHYIKDVTCPHGIFLNIDVHGGKNCLMLEINTQRARDDDETHEYKYFPFKDFDKALNEMEEMYNKLNKAIKWRKKLKTWLKKKDLK